MNNSDGGKKTKSWVYLLLVTAVLGGACYYAYTAGYLGHLRNWINLSSDEVKNAQGTVRDLRQVLVKDGPNAADREHINLFLLVSENGELIPLAVDYDNSGLQNGDRVSVTYATDDSLHRLAEAQDGAGKSSPYVAKYHRLVSFKLVTGAESPAPPAEKEAK